jgi:hypothetical protein
MLYIVGYCALLLGWCALRAVSSLLRIFGVHRILGVVGAHGECKCDTVSRYRSVDLEIG